MNQSSLAPGAEILDRVTEGPIRRVRSTLLCSSVAELRTRGHFEQYRRGLSEATADILVPGVAATWLPVALAVEHYAACERLGMSADEAYEFGATSAERLQHGVLKTAIAVARTAGVSPFTIFARYGRFWARHFDGGDLVVARIGAKDVLIDLQGIPLARFAFFRHAFRGGCAAGLHLFSRTVHVREQRSGTSSFCLRLGWA